MGKPLTFSVGIPTFNQAEYLEATIESLLEQTRPPEEIFISDHFSTDETPAIIEKYVRQGKVGAGKPPVGVNLAGQWQYTFSRLRGDWVTLLSSDDLARPNFAEVLMRGAARRADAVLVRAAWENIDAAGIVISKEYMLSIKPVLQPPETLISQRFGPLVSFAAFALKREALERSGPILQTMESLADWALFLQIAPFGSFIYENEIVSGYRIHPTDKFRLRLGMWIRDEQRITAEVLPLAAKCAGLTTPESCAWIGEAGRSNFARYLAAASEKFAPEERSQATEHFAPWAAQTGSEALLAGFVAGEKIAPDLSLVEKAKALARPLAHKLYAGLRRA